MKLDITFIPTNDLRADVELIRRAEALGFAAAWSAEAAHNPFFPLTIAAKETGKIQLGTQMAVAFPRSPMVTAQIAWDLARQSEGRFILGLGTQSQAHIERRFSDDWHDPVGRMREYIESLRAIWNTFQTDARLRYRGEHYTFRLMAPFFNPGPIDTPDIPIYLAGLNPAICILAGEHCQGLHAHSIHTAPYLRDVVLPAVTSGLKAADRAESDFSLTAPVLVVSGFDDTEIREASQAVKSRIARYTSSPECHSVLAHHGWESLADELKQLAGTSQWDALPALITDELLHEIAIVAEPSKVLARIGERYAGLADRVCLELDGTNGALVEAIVRG